MPTREDVESFRARLNMYLPLGGYPAVTGFFIGAQWASSGFLRDFQAFVSVELTGTLSLVWPAALVHHVLGEEAIGRVMRGAGTEEENGTAIETVFDAIDEYFVCLEAGRLDGVVARYEQMRNFGGNESER